MCWLTAAGRKILVMGDMGELGEDSVNMHSEVGAYALEAGIDALYAVGDLSASACAAFGGNHFQSRELLATAVAQELGQSQCRQSPGHLFSLRVSKRWYGKNC